jgi:integrase
MLKEGKSTATIGIYTRALRRLFNVAREYGVKADYPFSTYKPRKATAHKRALTAKQVSKIMQYKPREGTGRHFAKDMFLFSFFANGMNIGDILRLKYSNIQDNEIVFVREKTRNKQDETKIRVPLVDTLKNIINRWGQKSHLENVYIFPVLNGDMDEATKKKVIMNKRSNINRRLKKIAKDLELGHLSTVYARHSFATILKNSGASTEYIQEMLGHSNVKVTQNYLDSFEEDERLERAKKLEETIKSNTG